MCINMLYIETKCRNVELSFMFCLKFEGKKSWNEKSWKTQTRVREEAADAVGANALREGVNRADVVVPHSQPHRRRSAVRRTARTCTSAGWRGGKEELGGPSEQKPSPRFHFSLSFFRQLKNSWNWREFKNRFIGDQTHELPFKLLFFSIYIINDVLYNRTLVNSRRNDVHLRSLE